MVASLERGECHLWVATTVDEGLEILTGHPAGEAGDEAYPERTVHRRVQERRGHYAERARTFASAQAASATTNGALTG